MAASAQCAHCSRGDGGCFGPSLLDARRGGGCRTYRCGGARPWPGSGRAGPGHVDACSSATIHERAPPPRHLGGRGDADDRRLPFTAKRNRTPIWLSCGNGCCRAVSVPPSDRVGGAPPARCRRAPRRSGSPVGRTYVPRFCHRWYGAGRRPPPLRHSTGVVGGSGRRLGLRSSCEPIPPSHGAFLGRNDDRRGAGAPTARNPCAVACRT